MTVTGGGEALAGQLVMIFAQAGVKIIGVVSNKSARALALGLRLAGRQIAKVPGLPGRPEHGRMSVRQLQYTAGGDLHAQEVSPELVRKTKQQLKKRGIDFAVEKGKDGLTYFQFKGADLDSVRHAITQAAAAISRNNVAPDIDNDTPQTPAHETDTTTDLDTRDVGVESEWTPASELTISEPLTIDNALPPEMAALVGDESAHKVRENLDLAQSNGWTAQELKTQLSASPLPPVDQMYSPGGLIAARVGYVAQTQPENPAPATQSHVIESEQKFVRYRDALNEIIEGKSGLTLKQEFDRLNYLGSRIDVQNNLTDQYSAAMDAHQQRAKKLTPADVKKSLNEKIEAKRKAASAKPATPPLTPDRVKGIGGR